MERNNENVNSDEIEITPEMIEAGADAIMGFPLDDLAAEIDERKVAVTAVFRAMVAAGASCRGKSR